MKLSDFSYELPQELIAQHPAEPRDTARLMLYDKKTGETENKIFRQLTDELHQRSFPHACTVRVCLRAVR